MLLGLILLLALLLRRRGRAEGVSNSGGEGGGGAFGSTGVFDHQAHAVAGAGGYAAIDFDRKGQASVSLDGRNSHTHYYDPGPPVKTARIARFSWFTDGGDGNRVEFATGPTPEADFQVGKTIIGLTVADSTGDEHTDFTEVVVRDPVVPGAYCYYYYPLGAEGKNNYPVSDSFAAPEGPGSPKPVDAAQLDNGLQFGAVGDFPAGAQNIPFVARCVFHTPADGRSIALDVWHEGGPVKIVAGAETVFDSLASGTLTSTSSKVNIEAPVANAAELLEVQVIYWRQGSGEEAAVFKVNGMDGMQTDLGRVAPVLLDVDPTSSTLGGGGKAQVVGIGMFNRVQVRFNGQALQTNISNIDLNTAMFYVPIAQGEGIAYVTVANIVAESNSKEFMFSKSGIPPLKLEQLMFQPSEGVAMPKLQSGIAYGPDHRWYISSLDGHIYSFALSRDLVVTDFCKSENVGKDRAVLAVAFNPVDATPRVYASSAIIYWKEKIDAPDGWKNGMIHILEPTSDSCLAKTQDLITGLPVSNHDHGVNGMAFSQDGHLHFMVGGLTNAGFNSNFEMQGNKLGGMDEAPLSAACLVAPVLNSDFNGAVTYDSSDPGECRQTGGDVRVFASGLRNSFSMAYHSRNFFVATDNGANLGFGEKSTGCGDNDKDALGLNMPDELVKVIEGKYYGSPNRNRGRDNPLECTFRDPSEPSQGAYEAPLAVLESSTNGIMEMHSNLLGGQLKGNLLLSKLSTSENPGRVFRVRLNENNVIASGGADELWEASGLTIAMSPWGDIVMPQVYSQTVLVLRPLYDTPSVPMLAAVLPFRGPAAGGNLVQISGHNFGPNPVAYFDGRPCTQISNIAPGGTSFRCLAPPSPYGNQGKGVQVSVQVPGAPTAESYGGTDYKYMEI